MDKGAWWATIHVVQRVKHNLETKQQQQKGKKERKKIPTVSHLYVELEKANTQSESGLVVTESRRLRK